VAAALISQSRKWRFSNQRTRSSNCRSVRIVTLMMILSGCHFGPDASRGLSTITRGPIVIRRGQANYTQR